MNRWIRRSAWGVLGMVAWCGTTVAQNNPSGTQNAPAGTQNATQRPQNAPARAPGQPGRLQREPGTGGDLPGPINKVQELKDVSKILFKLADLNNDGMISEKEATDAANLIVGGYFFRADANGDGAVSKEEAQQARDSLLQQQPLLRVMLEHAEQGSKSGGTQGSSSNTSAVKNQIRGLATLLDSNNDRKIEASEVRKAVQTAVKSYYDAADTNRDGQLTPAEINAASVSMARQMMQSLFDTADADHNGSLSLAEYDKAIEAPANAFFKILDANGDGQLSKEEMQQASQMMFQQLQMLQVPDAQNAIGRSGSREPAPRGGNAPRSR